MAFITYRTSRGKKYYSIVESRRVNGKPRHVILEYLGSAQSLLRRLKEEEKITLKSYCHGDAAALLNIAKELDIINIINKHIMPGESGKKPVRDNLTVGASFVLAAIGRACHPTSKMGWYDWCKTTSLEYALKSSFKGLDSQHFWEQMNSLQEDKIPLIEEEIVKRLLSKYNVKLDTLLYDTSNFFTFIDSKNDRCLIPQRGRNKQKRNDLRQIGLALLVSKKNHFPLFHKSYEGNKNDVTLFNEMFDELAGRLNTITSQLTDITLVFDKGNNSKDNFKRLHAKNGLYYVGGLVPSYFKDLISEANQNSGVISTNGEAVPVYRIKKLVWGEERTCVVTVSKQLRDGQIRGIHQHLEKKYKALESFKGQLENPKRRKKTVKEEVRKRLSKIISGQFIEEILKYELVEDEGGGTSFTYYVDSEAFEKLQAQVLGRKLLVTNRHEWSSEEIILAYKGLAKVEYSFKNLKNPYHLCVRPQYHWTDQKIRAHILICVIGYLLTTAAYAKVRTKAGYKRNISNFMEELKGIRLACGTKRKSKKVRYLLEAIPKELKRAAKALGITETNIRVPLEISVYN